jgi:8-oxo-dGTP pyrophosphatase MutT (NUDIX family)
MNSGRERALRFLMEYSPADPGEREMLSRMRGFVAGNEDCFERHLAIGHMTGSAWILDAEHEHVLLTHHAKLNRWMQLGGHADGNPDLLAVAMREAREESGLAEIRVVSETPFDVDIHEIPARGDEAAHFHYDVRFLLQANRAGPLVVSEESHELAWVPLAGLAERGDVDESLRRMVRKTLGQAFHRVDVAEGDEAFNGALEEAVGDLRLGLTDVK